jgi:hypothetical protein
MKWLKSLIFLTLLVSCFSQAQNRSSTILLGSTQSISNSDFCKKYKCKAVYDKQLGVLTHYLLTLDTKFSAETTFSPRYDQKKQLVYSEFGLREDFRSNRFASYDESEMLADFIRYATGIKLNLEKNVLNRNFAPDILTCFAESRAFPEENFERLTRAMIKGQVLLQIEKKKVAYRAVCSSRFNGSSSEMYRPSFWIEIPSKN